MTVIIAKTKDRKRERMSHRRSQEKPLSKEMILTYQRLGFVSSKFATEKIEKAQRKRKKYERSKTQTNSARPIQLQTNYGLEIFA